MDRCLPDTGSNGDFKKTKDPTEPIWAVQPTKATPLHGTAEEERKIKKPKRLKGEDQLLPLEMS